MKIVDKEQERIEYEQTPEGKRKKLIHNILFAVFAIAVIIAAYIYYHS